MTDDNERRPTVRLRDEQPEVSPDDFTTLTGANRRYKNLAETITTLSTAIEDAQSKKGGKGSTLAIVVSVAAVLTQLGFSFGDVMPWQNKEAARAEYDKIRQEEKSEHDAIRGDIKESRELIDGLPAKLAREMRRR